MAHSAARLLSSGHSVSGGRQKDNKSSAKIKAFFQKPKAPRRVCLKHIVILLA